MFAINRRQVYRIAKRTGTLRLSRGNAYQAGEMAVKSPREVSKGSDGSPQLNVDL
jgi:hypothetical protein